MSEVIVDTNGISRGKEGREISLSVTNTFPSAKLANRFLQSAIIQGALITLLAVLFISIQLFLSSNINIVQFLSLSFEGPAKWILRQTMGKLANLNVVSVIRKW